MREQRSMPKKKHRKIIAMIVIAIALVSVTPVLADYIGPNRTITETTTTCKVILYQCKYVPAKDTYRYRRSQDWSCSNQSQPWDAYPDDPPRACSASAVGEKYWNKEETSEVITSTYPPATIIGDLQNCTQNNGWCTSSPQLSLTTNEPVPGYSIIGIEGTWNNQLFACPGSNCNIPLSEGDNNFTYWAHSSWTDTSVMGSLSARVDSQQPAITGTLNGTSGSNGWYIGPVLLNTSASDATSGLASFTCTLDGAPLDACNSITVNTEGPHTLVLTARDNAGLTRNLTQSPSIDSQSPVLDLSLVGRRDAGSDWYTAAALNGSASDASPGSGLSAFEYRVDQADWVTFPASGELTLPEGKHTVDVRAIDNAGLTASSVKSYWLDRVAPSITLYPDGTFGRNNWYISALHLTASASDETSGMDVFEYSLNNSLWTAYAAPLVLSDGIHDISFWAEDTAGLVTQENKTYKVDTRVPDIGGNLSGIPGENGWFTSDVTLSASAFDPLPGSGIDALTYTLDGSPEDAFSSPLLLSDGEHTVQLNARDSAGLSFTLEQVVNVDTILPSLEVQTTLPGWVKETVTLSGTADDDGSGLSKVEISTDGEKNWQTVTDTPDWNFSWNTQNSANGLYEVVVRATDKAGLTTRQTIKTGVDNKVPEINLPASWFQWDTISLDIQEEHSGLSDAHIEISDPKGRWPARIIALNGAQFPMQFKWDRRFTSDTIAPPGTYNVKVIAVDQVGHSAIQSASIKVLVGLLPAGPTATPLPPARPSPTPTTIPTFTATPANTATQAVVVKTFGSTPEPVVTATPGAAATPTPRATPTTTSVLDRLESIFTRLSDSMESTTQIGTLEEPAPLQTSNPGSNVLWGATAAAVMGSLTAYALEERRKQLEEKARQEALEAQAEERRTKIKAKQLAKLEAQWAQERAREEAVEAQEQQREALYQSHMEARLLARELEEEARRVAEQKAIRESREEKKRAEEQKKKAEDLQAGLAAYYNATRQGEETVVTATKEKPFWEKAVDWADKHQTEIALGIGVVAGVAAIVLSGGLATPAVALAWVAAAGAAAAGSAAVGTIALNRHYKRDWKSNLIKNMTVAGLTALVVTGGWFLLHAAISGIGGYCAVNQNACARIEPVFNAIDLGEELSLNAKLTFQTWRGDQGGASQTALEIQMEHLDGGMPGNSVAKEVGVETIEKVAQYGDEAVDLFRLYGIDAAEIIFKYGDDGIDLLQKYGLDAISLIGRYEDNAIKVLNIIDPKAAENLLDNLDDDVLDYALKEGDDALDALSRWSPEDLRLHGIDLALRSKKDAKALANVQKLIASRPIDPQHLTEEQKILIDAIAEYSTQYADEGQVVLGKWVDYGNGFVETARNTGSVHYNPHPDMWNMLSELGREDRSQVAWLINQQVIQTGINKGLPFEYSLNGIAIKDMTTEINTVEAVFSGATNSELLETLGNNNIPIRIRELQVLYDAGYRYSFDELTNSFILYLP